MGVDISYVWTTQGWLYLAIVVDLYSRGIIGWAVSDRVKQDLTLTALRRTIATRRPPKGVIHHFDRRGQCCATDDQKLLKAQGFILSMSGKGNCYDNTMEETVFKTIKSELIWRTVFKTRCQVEIAMGDYINTFYNSKRIHSFLVFKRPIQFESIPIKLAARISIYSTLFKGKVIPPLEHGGPQRSKNCYVHFHSLTLSHVNLPVRFCPQISRSGSSSANSAWCEPEMISALPSPICFRLCKSLCVHVPATEINTNTKKPAHLSGFWRFGRKDAQCGPCDNDRLSERDEKRPSV